MMMPHCNSTVSIKFKLVSYLNVNRTLSFKALDNVLQAVRIYFAFISLLYHSNASTCNCRKLLKFFCVKIEDGTFPIDAALEAREKPYGIAFRMYSAATALPQLETPRLQGELQQILNDESIEEFTARIYSILRYE